MLTCGQHGQFTAKRTKVSELVNDNRFDSIFLLDVLVCLRT